MNETDQGLRYRGFKATIYFDEDAGVVLGRVPTTRGSVEFTCGSMGAIRPELHTALDAFLAEHPDAKPVEHQN